MTIDHPAVIEALSRFWPRMNGFNVVEINRALIHADEKLGERTWLGNRPMLVHCVETAIIADEILHNEPLVLACILHETDCEELNLFGHEVAHLVLNTQKYPGEREQRAENLALERTPDENVLILARTLHVLRNIPLVSERHQPVLAMEAMNWIVPLAVDFPLIHQELKNICQIIIDQEQYRIVESRDILKKIKFSYAEAEQYLTSMRHGLEALFDTHRNGAERTLIQKIMTHTMNTQARLSHVHGILEKLETRL